MLVESDDILSLTVLTAWASAVVTPGVGPWTAAAPALASLVVGPCVWGPGLV